MKTIFKNAWPYQDDVMKLPVADVDAALPFYESIMGFSVTERFDSPYKQAVLERDGIRVGLEENGGDSSQAGVAFEVNDVAAAHAEFNGNGLVTAGEGPRNRSGTISPNIDTESQDGVEWKVFYIVAPDGLCYWIGERSAGS